MPVYLLHAERSEPFELIRAKEKLLGSEGKFLYFAPTHTLVIADSLELYHKDIFLHCQSGGFRGIFPVVGQPTAYGRIQDGEVCSWVSHFFGETDEVSRTGVVEVLSMLGNDV